MSQAVNKSVNSRVGRRKRTPRLDYHYRPPFLGTEQAVRRFKPRYDEKWNFSVNKILSSMKLEALLYV
jgi:hypothetical protein